MDDNDEKKILSSDAQQDLNSEPAVITRTRHPCAPALVIPDATSLSINEKILSNLIQQDLYSEPAGIQTPSLLIRSQMLYSVKLQAQLT